MEECSGGNTSWAVNIGVNLNSTVSYRLSRMTGLGRSLAGTLKANLYFAGLATSLFISGCLQEKGVSGWEESTYIYNFNGLSLFGNLKQKPAVLWESMVGPWPCQGLYRHTLESVCKLLHWKQWICNSFTTKEFPPEQPRCLGCKNRIYGSEKIDMNRVIVLATESWRQAGSQPV